MKTRIYFFFLSCLVLLCQSCKKPVEITESLPDPEEEKALITDVIHNSICWAMTKDTVKLYGSLVQDTTLFIIHPDTSTVKNFETIRYIAENVWLDDRFRATECNIRNLRIQLSQGGDVAWYSCILDDAGEWDGQAAGWYDTRWTGVLEKRNGRWVIMQMHFSFATGQE